MKLPTLSHYNHSINTLVATTTGDILKVTYVDEMVVIAESAKDSVSYEFDKRDMTTHGYLTSSTTNGLLSGPYITSGFFNMVEEDAANRETNEFVIEFQELGNYEELSEFDKRNYVALMLDICGLDTTHDMQMPLAASTFNELVTCEVPTCSMIHERMHRALVAKYGDLPYVQRRYLSNLLTESLRAQANTEAV